ncbi:MAG TPA: efflux RND transporter periplasmic adaptor subunit [Kiritimatiellia bacterium]|mgnify:CR=1 FL=1|nr:efflux RND transporter periplasmic adaptor subunit [Kiritimatiellia bacterium]
MMSIRGKGLIGLAVLIPMALAVSRCGSSGAVSGGPATAATAVAELRTMVVEVKASGEIQARESNRVIPRIKRGSMVTELVPEGSRVQAGEVVARFATDDIERRIREAENNLEQAELRVVSARTELEIEELETSTSLNLALQAVRDGEMELEKFNEGDRPKDIRNAELRVETTQSNFERSIRKHAEAVDLLKEGFVTEDQVEEERMAMETARVDRESAILDLRILNEFDLPLREARVESGLAKARTDLEKTRKRNEVQLKNRQQAYDTAVQGRDRIKLELAELRKELEDHTVVAPTDGVVTYGDPNNPWRRGDIQVGMNLNPGEVLLTIPNMASVQAVVNVSESDVDKVAVGQRASVVVDAMAGRTFEGEVKLVAEIANPGGWMAADVKEFKVEILLANGAGLRPGFSCRADIETDRAENVLSVPVQAVFREGDQFQVFRTSGRGVDSVPVEVGRVSMTHAEIRSGLAAGDRVLLTAPEPSS